MVHLLESRMSDSYLPPAPPLELSIVMPALNEARTIVACINAAATFLETNQIAGEILIGDNGSTDGTIELAQQHGARVISIATRGYGAAIAGAVEQARGKYVIMGDSDQSYDFSDLMAFVTALRNGNDLVMGNRFRGGIKPGAMPWKNRYIGNPILSTVGRALFRSPIRDFHCGLRGFSVTAFQRMDLQTTGMEFASEMVIKARLLGLRVTEVPTTLSPDGRDRPPHLRPWRDGWRHLRFMLLFSPRWLFLYPGLLLIFFGLCGYAVALPGLRIGRISLDVHTLLFSSLAIILGYDMVTFGAITKIYAITEQFEPAGSITKRLFQLVTLERGIIVAFILIAVGVFLSGCAVRSWVNVSFGDLDYTRTMRLAIPGCAALAVGVQTLLASIFLSIMGLRRKPR
jgi:glycosyltransferase involved in cell wall biosynthesis